MRRTALLRWRRAALAHHAFAAEFDANKPVNLRGTGDAAWSGSTRTPGSTWTCKNADGKVTKWMVEGGTPNTLLRRGITKDRCRSAPRSWSRGYQAKDGCAPKCRANGRDMTFPDGRKLFMGSSGTGAPKDGADPTEKQ